MYLAIFKHQDVTRKFICDQVECDKSSILLQGYVELNPITRLSIERINTLNESLNALRRGVEYQFRAMDNIMIIELTQSTISNI